MAVFKFENATSTNGGPWIVIPDDCGENWCRTIFFTHNMGVVDHDSAVWGDVDTLAASAPATRTPASGGTSVHSPGSPVAGGGGAPAGRLADDTVLTRVSLADIERLMIDAGFAPGLSGDYPGFQQATDPNGVRFHASGIACDDPDKVKGCAGIILLVDVSVKTMQTVLRYPDEKVTWEAINAANTQVNLITTYFDQPRNALMMKRVLLLGAGGQTVANIKGEIASIAVTAKTVIDVYIWPKG